MDLGIQGRRAIVCGSSRGLGKACAEALAQEGVFVVINGREAADVEQTVVAINSAHPGQAVGAVGDVTTDEGRNAVLPAMIKRRFGRIINITSAMVTTPRPHMLLSAAPRAGLMAAMKAISLDVARYNITINNMLPERMDTDRQHFMAQQAMKRENISYEVARQKQVESIAARRLGEPREFGAMCTFLCGTLAGFISGSNMHLDGGSYPALV
jgi:3-oxoacyl-[acyl-carrier protein] reductase